MERWRQHTIAIRHPACVRGSTITRSFATSGRGWVAADRPTLRRIGIDAVMWSSVPVRSGVVEVRHGGEEVNRSARLPGRTFMAESSRSEIAPRLHEGTMRPQLLEWAYCVSLHKCAPESYYSQRRGHWTARTTLQSSAIRPVSTTRACSSMHSKIRLRVQVEVRLMVIAVHVDSTCIVASNFPSALSNDRKRNKMGPTGN